jgi:23S rRNA maturation mini-RNase III
LYDQLLSNSSTSTSSKEVSSSSEEASSSSEEASSSSEDVSSNSQLQLTPGEAALLRRVAAWEAVKLRKRFATPAAAETYRKATALEALVSGTL